LVDKRRRSARDVLLDFEGLGREARRLVKEVRVDQPNIARGERCEEKSKGVSTMSWKLFRSYGRKREKQTNRSGDDKGRHAHRCARTVVL
jgi:hypothetical protein